MNRAQVLEQLVERTHEGFWFIDAEARTIDVNPAMCRILGRPREDILGRSIFDFVDAENLAIFQEEIAARRSGARTGTYEIALLRPDGATVECINNASSVWNEDGVRIGSIGLWTDVSHQKATEAKLRYLQSSLEDEIARRTAELRQSEMRLREANSVARLGAWNVTEDGTLEWSDEVFEILGVAKEDFDGTSDTFYRAVHPDDRQRVREDTLYAWTHLDRYETVHRVVLADGAIRTVRESAAVIRNEEGVTSHLSGTVQDITEQVAAEEQLRQAQKMDSLGKLTGGIAHDFNNLLAVVLGSAEFLQMERRYDEELVSDILSSAERGAELTRRMLAYARRQPLHSTNVDLAGLVGGMIVMLRRTLGAHISVHFGAARDLWQATADPGQVENAILNMAINARDAMPTGGDLSIECINAVLDDDYVSQNPEAKPGEFVVLAVSDNGTGMPDDVRRNATDPFFTTKGSEGTGLGLSMVYGFAQQSGGHLTIYSEVGEGTTVKLYLPRASREMLAERDGLVVEAPTGRGERILVIEDDSSVRSLSERLLTALGYKPVAVEDAHAAIALLKVRRDFDLVLTDVVLPNNLSGPEFAKTISADHPDLPVIFMSGYPSVAAERNGFPGSGNVLLNKPFRRKEVATAIRAALDAKR